jgi:glycosyltransferase involved in cell wall biosynthesis
MKIAIFCDSWVPNLNGVVISIINEVQSLKNKHEFIIFVPKIKQSKPFRIEGVPIYELRSFPFPAYPGYNIALPSLTFSRAIQREEIDFIHCHSPFSLGYGAVLTARKIKDLPLLNTYHTDLVNYSGHLIGGFQAERFTPWFENFAWIYIRWFYKYSDVVITPSKTLQQDLKSHGVKPPVYALPNMISSVFFDKRITSNSKRFQDQIRKEHNISPNKRIIIYCGRISYEKKLEVMLKAFKQIENTYKDIFLLIVGDGPHLKMYKKQALDLKLKNYAFTGFLSHTKLPHVYQMGEFMVTPSDTETQGLTVIEAMSQSLPVIGVASGGVLDYIHDGKNGFLVPPGDHEAFAQALTRFIENPELISEYGRNAFKTAQKYSKEGFISLLEKVFKITQDAHSR